MKKKIISIVLAVILGLSILTFVGCGSNGDCDCSTTAAACNCTTIAGCDCGTIPTACDCSAVAGCYCESIPATCDCTHGNIGCNCATTELPVVSLGETFYFYDFGVRLFRVYFFESTTFAGRISMNFTNHGFSSVNLNTIFRFIEVSSNNIIVVRDVGSMTFANGESNSFPLGTDLNTNIGYVWVGFPIGITMRGFMILNTNTIN